MKKRENIVQKFSTFLKVGDRKFIWQSNPLLERQIERLVNSDPLAKEEFWARYFLKALREVSQGEKGTVLETKLNEDSQSCCDANESKPFLLSPVTATQHLSAYLQEACFWTAQKSYFKYKQLRYKYQIEEYFQVASMFANVPAKLLRSFDLDHPRSNIENYAKTAIFRFVRDKIYRQELEAKRDKFSDYGLLRVLSHKELKEALENEGVPQSTLDLYRLVWQCFDEIYQPKQPFGNRNLDPPTWEDLRQIADAYNRRLNQLDLAGAIADPNKIQEMLGICIRAARNYRTKQLIPLEECDRLSDPNPTPWDLAIREEERQQVQLILAQLFSNIPKLGKVILILWQGLNLTQSEIANILNSQYPELQKQYQVARSLAKYNKTIFQDFVKRWNQVNPESVIADEQDLSRIKDALAECLQWHCKRFLEEIGERSIERIDEESLNFTDLREQTNSQHQNKRLKSKETFIRFFASSLEVELGLRKNAILLASSRISDFVEEWLKETNDSKS